MAEGSAVPDPPAPVPVPVPDPKPADVAKSEVAIGTEAHAPAPTPKPETKEEVKDEGGGQQKPAVASEAQTKKRKSVTVDEFRNSAYFKIRSIIKDLRPFFIEVIHAPDFRESNAANDIRKQMKTMLELTKQLGTVASLDEPEKPEEQPLPGASKEEKHDEGANNVPQPHNGDTSGSSGNAMGNAAMCIDKTPEVKENAKLPEQGLTGTYVIGGSPVGWNFLAYPGTNPSYAGETRESFRSRQTANCSSPI